MIWFLIGFAIPFIIAGVGSLLIAIPASLADLLFDAIVLLVGRHQKKQVTASRENADDTAIEETATPEIVSTTSADSSYPISDPWVISADSSTTYADFAYPSVDDEFGGGSDEDPEF